MKLKNGLMRDEPGPSKDEPHKQFENREHGPQTECSSDDSDSVEMNKIHED